MTPYKTQHVTIYQHDVKHGLPMLDDGSVNCCVTSPPYWGLRDYGVEGQIGLEATPELYAERMVQVFREVRRVLRDDGTLWLNLGDTYNAGRNGGHPGGKKQWNANQIKYQGKSGANVANLKPKDIIGIPWRTAFALQADGWYLRSDIIWHKPNPMPESVTDRPTKSHEYIFLLAKSERYWFDSDSDAWKEPAINGVHTRNRASNFKKAGSHSLGNHLQGAETIECDGNRNKRTVWTIPTKPYPGAHFATFPPDLIRPCIMAGCPEGGIVLDPFLGSGTTAYVARQEGRRCVGIEISAEYIALAKRRLQQRVLSFEGSD